MPRLRDAVADLGWLFGRGYVDPSASKLVGDRYRLRLRQRTAVSRSAASAQAVTQREQQRRDTEALAGEALAVDAFNVLIGIETALGGGVLLRGADGALRDLSSVHGSYRRVDVTTTALEFLARTLAGWKPRAVTWYVDRPVSNSGRLAGWIRDLAPPDVDWTVELPYDADGAVIDSGAVACSADARVIEHAAAWADLASATVAAHVPQAWVVDLRAPPS